MSDVGFYQLSRRSLDAVLPRLLDKALSGGHRAVVCSGDAALLKRLDSVLWTYDPASFLPHAVDGEYAAAQPVLLTGDGAANGATLLAVVDGVLPGNFGSFARVLYIFDGGIAETLATARMHWRSVKAEAHDATYWRETDTGWEKAA